MAHLLIVDDERNIRRILSLMLRDRGHRVDEAADGASALEHIGKSTPDLVLLDLRLPDTDGLAVMEKLHAHAPDIGVIMMTAHGTISTAVEAMRQGAFDYITKPFDNEKLLLLVERALDLRRSGHGAETPTHESESRCGFSEIIGISPAMQKLFRTLAKVARVDATVLISGESGTGKELVARGIHRRSPRRSGPFVAVNCSAIPQTLFEAEFFGHERGAFTDARATRAGFFEQAEGGSLFLDEVGELASDAQAKLLRALQERTITRLGGRAPRPVDVRVIAATNRQLEAEVRTGNFREDLYWRLNVVQITLPPLRERREDLELLFDHFLERINRDLGLSIRGITPEARQRMLDHPWGGNVRELENTLCRAAILCETQRIGLEDLPSRVRRGDSPAGARESADPPSEDSISLGEAVRRSTAELEKRMVLARLEDYDGNRTRTAKSLGISRKTLFNKMRQYGLGVTGEDIEDDS